MRYFIKLNKWYLVQLTDLVCIGQTSSGEIVTERVDLVDLDNKWLVTKHRIYRLGEMDKVWSGTPEARKLVSVLL